MNQYQAELYHHGVKGQKWGIRRYQNPDGTLTAAGMKRYGVAGTNSAKYQKDLAKDQKRNSPEYRRKMKKIKIGAAITAGVLAHIGVYTVSRIVKRKATLKAMQGLGKLLAGLEFNEPDYLEPDYNEPDYY